MFFGSVQSSGSPASGERPGSIDGNITTATTAMVAKQKLYQGNDSYQLTKKGTIFMKRVTMKKLSNGLK